MPQLKKYFKHSNIPDIVQAYPLPGANRRSAGGGNSPEAALEKEARRVFTHFVIGLLNPNPWKRWTPKQVCMQTGSGSGWPPVCPNGNGVHVGSEIVGWREGSCTLATTGVFAYNSIHDVIMPVRPRMFPVSPWFSMYNSNRTEV